MEIHICSITEYNAETRMPTIVNPNSSTFYLVPTEDGTSPDLFTEWVYVNGAWEMFGSASADLTDYVKNTDLNEVEEKVEQNTQDLLKAFPIETASGSIASFEDGVNDIPLQSLVVDINPVQDLHGYDSPWVGGGGKNLLDFEQFFEEGWTQTVSGLTVKYSKGHITVKGTNTSSSTVIAVDKRNVWTRGDVNLGAGQFATAQGLAVVCYADGSATNVNGTVTVSTSLEPTGFFVGVSANATVDIDVPLMIVRGGTRPTVYSPYENICPISGWEEVGVNQSGVNVWDEEWEVGTYSTTTGNKATASNMIRSTNLIPVVPGVTYRISGTFSLGSYNGNLLYYDKDKTFVSSNYWGGSAHSTKTIPDGVYYIAFSVRNEYGTSYNNNIYVNYPSADHDYHPYTGRSITIDLGQTVYGGKLDVVTGELVVDDSTDVYDGDERVNQILVANGCRVFTLPTVGALSVTNADTEVRVKTDKLKPNSASRVVNQAVVAYQCALISGDRIAVSVPDTIEDVTAFKAWLAQNNLQVVYPLAAPLTVQLTPNQVNSLLGVNNIWADSGDTSAEYRADPDLYIQRKMLEVPVDDVQINGTSIVQDGVANVPIASNSALGAVKIGDGLQMWGGQSLRTQPASITSIKSGTNSFCPIVPQHQHESAFYGLAKSAGDTTQSQSSNVVGQYTEDAKSAISDMLNGAVQISGTDPTINAMSGIRYVCGEVLSLNFTPSATGICDVVFASGSTPTVVTLPSTVKFPDGELTIEADTTYEINILDGVYGAVMAWT